ncbi:MAG: enoyl-CoA hydratase-related protein [Gemmatimonadota bacterium]|nr:enoyl-CoA hydratase-related protein [Gemmatimonadota bacterium]
MSAVSDVSSAGSHVLVEIEDAVATLTLNRPEKLNSFYGTMRDELTDALEEIATSEDVRAVVVTGAGRAFCAGADVGYLTRLIESGNVDEATALVEAGRRVVMAVRSFPGPVIAAINGAAAGGGANLALACDLRIASERASIGQTFNRIGLAPDWGGSYHLPRLVGPALAAELFFFAEMIDAEEAERIGLVNRVVPHDELMETARGWARRLAAKPALAVRYAKRMVQRSLGSTVDEMLDFETAAQRDCFGSPDALEGVRAFTEKRRAVFGRTGAPDRTGAPEAAAAPESAGAPESTEPPEPTGKEEPA